MEAVLINGEQYNTAAAEAVRPFLFEMLDFIADLHVLAKIKKETTSDAVGGDLKVRLAEVIASEMSRSNGRDCRTVIRFIPWLMSPPSVTQVCRGGNLTWGLDKGRIIELNPNFESWVPKGMIIIDEGSHFETASAELAVFPSFVLQI